MSGAGTMEKKSFKTTEEDLNLTVEPMGDW